MLKENISEKNNIGNYIVTDSVNNNAEIDSQQEQGKRQVFDAKKQKENKERKFKGKKEYSKK